MIQALELAATAGSKPVLGVKSILDMGPKVWQPLMQGLQAMSEDAAAFLGGHREIFKGHTAQLSLFVRILCRIQPEGRNGAACTRRE